VTALVGQGFNDCEISRLTDIPRSTIREWRHAERVMGAARRWRTDSDCPRCGNAQVDGTSYAYLLGLYLGDGWTSAHPRGVYKHRIVMDARYPSIIEESSESMRRVRPSVDMKVGRARNPGCIDLCSLEALAVSVSSTGPGRKHRRKIQLDPWQVRIVDSYPDQLLRGLIHSDGYRGTNYVNGRGYPRYQFSNRSKDIRGIFCRACDMYGVRWRQMNRWVISVARAPDVAKLDQVIGPKS
jgi:hypothetical protein